MPLPSSVMPIRRLPPPSVKMSIRLAPASIAFSTSSLTTLAGRSTTSPAAMRLTICSGNWRTGMGLGRLWNRQINLGAFAGRGEGKAAGHQRKPGGFQRFPELSLLFTAAEASPSEHTGIPASGVTGSRREHCDRRLRGISFRKAIKRSGGDRMCQLFAHQPQRDYESQTRSLRIDGHCTSIRLEMSFCDTLEEIAAKEGMTLAKFVTTLQHEVLDPHGEVNNFASLLRCSCLIYRAKTAAATPVPEFRHEAAILDAAE